MASDLWDYDSPVRPLADSSDDEEVQNRPSNVNDVLPDTKRRKYADEPIVLDLDADSSDGEGGSRNGCAVLSAAPTPRKALPSPQQRAADGAPPAPPAALAPEIAALMRRNADALAHLRECAAEGADDDVEEAEVLTLEGGGGDEGSESDGACPSPAAEAEGGGGGGEVGPCGKVQLKLQCAKGTQSFRIGTGDPFSRLFAAFAAHAEKVGWCEAGGGAGMRFVFDGETLGGGATAAELDCEEDDIIEVHGL